MKTINKNHYGLIKKIIVWSVLVITFISACVGIIASVMELFSKWDTHKPYGPYERYIKRGLDAFLATGALIVFSPLLLITALLVRIKLGSPVIFSQDRPGKDEKIFKLYKFRSMNMARGEDGNLLPDIQRITKFGRLLRNTSLDELPELINIVKGDLSVVGPRPLLIKYLPLYNLEQRHRHDVRPGLTGYAQAHGRNCSTWTERFKMDVEYTKKITFKGDMQIILDTIKAVLKHEGINSDATTKFTMNEFTGEEDE